MGKFGDLKLLLSLSKKKYLLLIQIFTSIVLSLISVRIGQLIKTFVDSGLNYNIKELFIEFLFLSTFGAVFTGVSSYSCYFFSIHLIEKLRSIIAEKMLCLKYNYYEGEYPGKLNTIISYDIEAIQNYITGSFVGLINGIFMFVCSFIYLLAVNAKMTLICTISIPITLVFAKIVLNPIYNSIEKFADKMDETVIIVKDTLAGFNIEKAYSLQNVRRDKFNLIMDQATGYYVDYEKVAAVIGSFKYVIKSLPTFICIIMGFINIYQGQITNGEFISFIILLRNLSNPLSELPSYITAMKEAFVSSNRINDILNLEEEQFGSEKPEICEKVIVFNHVNFGYHREALLFKDLFFEVTRGKKIAIVGSSGSGKTTIFKLITGFYTPDNGNIKLYNRSLNEWDIEKAREEISIVSQDIYLFPDTIEANIAYGCNNASKEDIIKVSKMAYAHEFIMKMSEGYKTMLGERGVNLSGGQKQRIAIARAFLKNAPILLLDEMSSALDKESEILIKKSIEEYSTNRTVIMIAHRISTIENADEILVLDKGKIVEKGTHKELISINGVYARLNINQEIQV